MRKVLIATHAQMAEGIKKTAEFIIGENDNISVINAYIDDVPLKEQVAEFLPLLDETDELVILTDMLAGSVNQELSTLAQRDHTHILTGVNLPLVLGIILDPTEYLTTEAIYRILAESKNAMIYVNEFEPEFDEDDE